jgi:hypothetical protein
MIPDLERLKKLIVDFGDDDRDAVNSLEYRLQEAIAKEELQTHLVIQDLRKQMESDVAAINILLTTKYSKDLPDRERDYLLDNKALYQRFIEALGGESGREEIERQIKDYLANAHAQLL